MKNNNRKDQCFCIIFLKENLNNTLFCMYYLFAEPLYMACTMVLYNGPVICTMVLQINDSMVLLIRYKEFF